MTLLKEVPIDYSLFGKATSLYRNYYSYSEITVPWMVESKYSMLTCPNQKHAFKVFSDTHLVGSAEQGFLQYMLDTERLNPYTKYMAITPCFRRGDEGEIHSETFMKLELFMCTHEKFFYNASEAESSYFGHYQMASDLTPDAINVLQDLGAKYIRQEIVDNNDPCRHFDTNHQMMYTIQSFDLYAPYEDGEIEIGSYGRRRIITPKMDGYLFQEYYYGTGLALPRFQLVI